MNEVNNNYKFFRFATKIIENSFERKDNELVIGLYFGHITEKNHGAQAYCLGRINKEEQLMIAYCLLDKLKFENQKITDLLHELLSIGNLDDLDFGEEICQSSEKS